MRLRKLLTATTLGIAAVVPFTVAEKASAWPEDCTHFYSNQFGTGYAHGWCDEGSGYYQIRVRCHPVGTTASYVSRFGDWKHVSSGIRSTANCGPRYPIAFDSDVFGSMNP